MADWQQVPANSRNMEPRNMTANRTEKTGKHRGINRPRKKWEATGQEEET